MLRQRWLEATLSSPLAFADFVVTNNHGNPRWRDNPVRLPVWQPVADSK
jgi:hypothetical protein